MSGLIPQPFIDDLLHRLDLVEFIDSYIPLKKRGSSYLACCPFHHEKTPSFNVIAKKQFYHCFGCGASGNAISFVMNYLNQSFTQAIETLAMRLGLKVPREGQQEKQNHSGDLYKLLQKIAVYYQKNLKKNGKLAQDYLSQRGVNEEVATLYQLGFASEGWHHLEKTFGSCQRELIITGMLVKTDEGKIYDRYRQRLMFPIHDRHGRLIGFGGRALASNEKPKYLNSPETIIFQKNRELYGLHQVLSQKKTNDSILLVEGYMDVIALAQYGICNAVATLGTATSIYHIQLLIKHTKRLICCFDGDEAGRQAAWRALESCLGYLNEGLDVHFVFLPEGEDPDSLVRKEGKASFITRLEQGVPLHRLFFDTLLKEKDIRTPAGKTQVIQLVKPYLLKMSEGFYKHLLMEELSRITRIQLDHLISLLSENDLKPHKAKASIERTPLRIAIALLLQYPEIYSQSAGAIDPRLLDGREHHLLIQLIQRLVQKPDANTASLLEGFRQEDCFISINQLAAWDPQVPEEARIKEFIDIVLFLQKQSSEQVIQDLINKSRSQGLTEAERIQLQDLLKKRHH